MPVSAPQVTKALFGGVFDVDGAGHYPGLELINLVVCCEEGVLPQSDHVHVKRAAHDFARKLIADSMPAERKSAVLLDGHPVIARRRWQDLPDHYLGPETP